MNHQDHVRLLRNGIPDRGGIWADLGSGEGAFTLALAECIGSQGEIYSVDKDRQALEHQQHAIRAKFPNQKVFYLTADYTHQLALPLLDGIVMANTLHFQRQKDNTLGLVFGYLRPGGRLLIVEYNVDRGNLWVPHPFSYRTWETLARLNGFQNTEMVATQPSRFLGEMYAAVSLKPG